MKILQLHNKLPYPPKDGGSIAIWNLSIELAKQGHEVTLLVMNTKKHYFPVQNIPNDVLKLLKIVSVNVDAPITVTGAIYNLLFSCLPYNAARFIDKRFKNKLIDLLTNEVYDVVQLEGLYVAPYINTIKKYSKAKIALRAHNIEHEIWNRIRANEDSRVKREYLSILTRRLKRFEIRLIKKTDFLLPITNRDASVFRTLGADCPMHVCSAGISLLDLEPKPEMIDYPSLFFIGALDWAPNQEGLVWFFNSLWDRVVIDFPEVKLYVAGRNCPKWLEKIMNKPNVEFLGEIDNAYSFMNSKSVMIAPIFSGSGMRVKIVEGMALGKTIITTTIGTEGIDTSHGLNILVADLADDYYKSIKEVLINKSFCENIGRNAIKFVRDNYDIRELATALINFYKLHDNN